jgi:hypothetical protein
MIRIEVTSEADVTRMVAAFAVLPVLAGPDYEIWLVSEIGRWRMRRAWRTGGVRGGSWPADWPGIEPDEAARELNR